MASETQINPIFLRNSSFTIECSSRMAIVGWHGIESKSEHRSASDRASESVWRIRFVFHPLRTGPVDYRQTSMRTLSKVWKLLLSADDGDDTNR